MRPSVALSAKAKKAGYVERLSIDGRKSSQHVEQNRHEVQQAASHDEQVPDAMPMAKAAVVGEEDDAHGVEHATGRQPLEAGHTQGGDQGFTATSTIQPITA